MKQTLLVAAFAVAASGASAESALSFVRAPNPNSTGIQSHWTGQYVGGYFSSAAGENNFITPVIPTEITGGSYGVYWGYRIDMGNYVYGVEIATTVGTSLVETGWPTWHYNSISDLKTSVGYDLGNTLIYGTLGLSYAGFTGGTVNTGLGGYIAGAGVEYKLKENLSIGGEVNYRDLRQPDPLWVGGGYQSQLTSADIRIIFQF